MAPPFTAVALTLVGALAVAPWGARAADPDSPPVAARKKAEDEEVLKNAPKPAPEDAARKKAEDEEALKKAGNG